MVDRREAAGRDRHRGTATRRPRGHRRQQPGRGRVAQHARHDRPCLQRTIGPAQRDAGRQRQQQRLVRIPRNGARPLDARATFEARYAAIEKRFDGKDVPLIVRQEITDPAEQISEF